MKSLNTFIDEGSSKKCPVGQYYCFTDKKCKKIPRGYFVGRRGYLEQEKDSDDNKNGGNGNGSNGGNGNGNGGNGNGSGNGGSNGGGNGGGMSEELNKDDKPFVKKLVGKLRKGSKTHAKQADDLEKAMNEEKKGDHEPEMIRSQLKTAARASKRIEKHSKKKENFKAWVQSKITKASDNLDTAADYLDSKDMKEESNPRIPRKPGQPAGSKKHSDLYTDENPKGTIHGLGFKDVATAKASVSKIRNSSRSHAHKIQAAVAMEQRAREMGKTSEAAVYRKFINTMKKKTKKMNEDVKRDEYGDPVGGPKISKKQKAKNLAKNTPDEQHTTTTSEAANPAQQAAIAINMKKKGKKPKDMSEEGLRDWFGKSSGTTKSGRRVRGWVQVGGKYDGKPCARQPGQKTTPKCVSSAKRRSMSKDERDSARRRKVAADPGQPQKTGAAKPTMVSTDPKKKMKENVSFAEAKDKKGKGSGTKDACYHKVKSRYSVWPSAYASGALVKCRKVGAANWGNSTKEEFVKDGISFQQFQEKCWKGYEKKGMKTMFGKRYPNCVKKEETEVVREDDMKGMSVKSGHKRPTKSGAGMTKKGVEAYRRRNPGSKLKTAVTTPPSKLKAGSKAANRRKSYCARSAGQMKKFPKAAKDPNSRLRQARRRWNC